MSSFAENAEYCLTFRQFESRVGSFEPHHYFEDRNCGFPDHDRSDPADQFDMQVLTDFNVYLGWCPVTWSSSERTQDIDEVDDCREILFLAADLPTATRLMRDTFGVHASVEQWEGC